MIIEIGTDPENLEVPEEILSEIKRACEVAAGIYGTENFELGITLTDDKHIYELNKKYRNIDRPTDVLSFAFRESEEPEVFGAKEPEILGDIIISLERAKLQAEEFGHSFLREVVFLTVHGFLHLIGYDHMEENDRIEMEKEQRFVMSKLGIERFAV